MIDQPNAKRIRMRLLNIAAQESQLKELIIEKRQYIAEQLRDVQAECTHSDVRFEPDPSGNGDSEYRCEICKKVQPRIFGNLL